MREIKFRAWDSFNKRMVIDNESVLRGLLFNVQSDGALDTLKFMQYTGLKDKNGREIYEGDIIYWEIDNGVGIESYAAIVQWSENNEKYKGIYKWIVLYIEDYLRGQFDALSTPASYNYELQVMGNIYENPELLEVSE